MTDPYTAVVRLSDGDTFGSFMNKLRVWFDQQKIQPRDFKTAPGVRGYAFKIGFQTISEAERFKGQFQQPAA